MRLFRSSRNVYQSGVSIHAPREGCDKHETKRVSTSSGFNSRTPGGVRRSVASVPSKRTEFQFTHPGRGATLFKLRVRLVDTVSIHAPREGCDRSTWVLCIFGRTFQFTHPGRGATAPEDLIIGIVGVSIHAPREGCDISQPKCKPI